MTFIGFRKGKCMEELHSLDKTLFLYLGQVPYKTANTKSLITSDVNFSWFGFLADTYNSDEMYIGEIWKHQMIKVHE